MSARAAPIGAAASPLSVSASQLTSLCYQSRPRSYLSAEDLDALVTTAQQRNGAESVTGLLIYDAERRRFFQWLEGPPEALARIWTSIQNDPRHCNVELLGSRPTPARFFAGWDLKVVSGSDDTAGVGRAAAMLALIDGHNLTPLLGRFRAASERQRTGALAELLRDRDPAGAEGFIATAHARSASLLETFAELFEPTARRLGDDWMHELCTEPELVIALGRLQSAAHRLASDYTPLPPRSTHAVLGTPAGEGHLLGSAMLGELLWLQGWQVDVDTGISKPPRGEGVFVACVSPALQRGIRPGWAGLVEPAVPRGAARRGVYGRLGEADADAWHAAGAGFVRAELREAFLDCCALDGRNGPEPNLRLASLPR